MCKYSYMCKDTQRDQKKASYRVVVKCCFELLNMGSVNPRGEYYITAEASPMVPRQSLFSLKLSSVPPVLIHILYSLELCN